ncbi:MAG: hypothetical protein HOJ87_04700 [Rhodospirillaceae bacterium]|nr:hypothetical protein [Rhodospirillaceae bacterium]
MEKNIDNGRSAESANFNKILSKFAEESCDRCHTIEKKELTREIDNDGLDGSIFINRNNAFCGIADDRLHHITIQTLNLILLTHGKGQLISLVLTHKFILNGITFCHFEQVFVCD